MRICTWWIDCYNNHPGGRFSSKFHLSFDRSIKWPDITRNSRIIQSSDRYDVHSQKSPVSKRQSFQKFETHQARKKILSGEISAASFVPRSLMWSMRSLYVWTAERSCRVRLRIKDGTNIDINEVSAEYSNAELLRSVVTELTDVIDSNFCVALRCSFIYRAAWRFCMYLWTYSSAPHESVWFCKNLMNGRLLR